MSPELRILWNETMQALHDRKADQRARGVKYFPDFYPIHSSFAHDDPEAHALALSRHTLEAEWSGEADENYGACADDLPKFIMGILTAHSEISCSREPTFESELWELPFLTAPKSAVYSYAA
ncbi:MAG: hypothetical protein RLZZ156_1346 [Deinococcota bacterium]|jgi:hypothetical protein